MKSALRKPWVPMTALTVLLVSALAFLYSATQDSGTSDYFENVALLRQLKQLDAQWEVEVLKSRIGIQASYDPLAAIVTELDTTLEKLGADLRAQKHEKAEALREAQSMLESSVHERAALVEQFKSSNAVLRSSRAFLPIAAQDIDAMTGPRRERLPATAGLSAAARELVLASVITSRVVSDDRADEILRSLAAIEARLPPLGDGLRERIGIFAAHVRMVLRQQRTLSDLLEEIDTVPTGARIDEIGNVLSGERLQIESRDQLNRTYLMIFSALLTALLVGAAIRLMRTHSLINRVNRELRGVNDTLEQRVREGTRELRQITDAVSVMIAYIDAERRFRFHNKAIEHAMGVKSEDIDGRTVREVVGDEVYESLRPWIDQALAGIPVRFENTRNNGLGVLRDYTIQYFPRRKDDRGDQPVIGYYALITDITETKRIDRMKTEFVSTVSHELRTPLTSIRGSLGLIAGGMAGVLPDAAKGLVEIAKTNCERLIRLINNILDSEKIESGSMQFDLNVVELQGLVAHSITANEGFAAQHGTSITLATGRDAIQVNVDSDGLNQVLTNLLSNAVKFSPVGGTVEVSVARVEERVRVEVRDHGPGIPDEFHARIFQKFSQADSSDSRQKGGTGLGLNISKAIVERLGGTIGFSGAVGGGTIFFFELPVWRQGLAAGNRVIPFAACLRTQRLPQPP